MGPPPNPTAYFRQRFFLWAPMRMWQIPLRCPTCNFQLSHSGIYPKAREVVDMDTRYYLIGADYPRCNRCKVPFCPWRQDLLEQLDPSHRNMFPAVLTKYGALDKKCITLMKPRTQGNSSSYIQQAIHELHSEEWGRRCLQYLTDCEIHKRGARLTADVSNYEEPPPFRPLPLAQWFETAHGNEILKNVDEMKSLITSTYGRVLKLDSTKKVTKKLAGDIGDTASWMTNIANENGQVLNSVLTTGEGPALYAVCQGIVKRYSDAGEPSPEVIYVDRDCCSQTGVPQVLEWFYPWTCNVRLDIFHFMRRFTKGLTTEHHPLYGTFCSKLSNCIFEWDQGDYTRLREAKKGELRRKFKGMVPTPKQVTAAISPNELAKHCRRQTREAEQIKRLIEELLGKMWDHTDTAGVRLVNAASMKHVWEVQQKHMKCILDPPGVDLYTKVGTSEKGSVVLDVLKCARGSSSLESFHRHQCAFIPGYRVNAVHTQMYMVEGCSRWNLNRTREAVSIQDTSLTRIYDIRLMSNINSLGQKILKKDLFPEYVPPGKPTDERVAVEYLLAQSGRGDMRPSFDAETGSVLPEIEPEAEESGIEELEVDDATLCLMEDMEIEFTTHDIGVPEVPSVESMIQCDRCGLRLNHADVVIHKVYCTDDSRTIPKGKSPIVEATSVPVQMIQCDRCGLRLSHADVVMHKVYCKDDSRTIPKGKSPIIESTSVPVHMSQCDRCGIMLNTGDMVTHVITCQEDSGNSPEQKSPISDLPDSSDIPTLEDVEEDSSLGTRHDTKGFPGWEKVDSLAAYLVDRLDTSKTALSVAETNHIVCLYDNLCEHDKSPTKYTTKSKKEVLPGPWRASRKRSGSTPGVQASERLFMTHGRAAQTPDTNRISECVCIRLWRIYQSARNRPKDAAGKTLQVAHAIVKKYSLLQQLLEDSKAVQDNTNLVLVTINNTTVNAWIHQRQKRADREALLQGTDLPRLSVSKKGLPKAKDLPKHHKQSGHKALTFMEPENQEGQFVKRPRNKKIASATDSGSQSSLPHHDQSGFLPSTLPGPPHYLQGYPTLNPWQQYYMPSFVFPQPGPLSHQQAPQQPLPHIQIAPPILASTQFLSSNLETPTRQQQWRQRQAAKEDQERLERGEPPIKRHAKKRQYRYNCSTCGKQKSAETGHTQVKGKWYCPSLGITVEEWRNQLKK